MEGKLRILMQSENLTASRLAEILEVKPAAISHILSGRNKPSFELLCKLINRFPQINPYWLLGDATEMTNANAQITTSEGVTSSATLFDQPSEKTATTDVINFADKVPRLPRSEASNAEIEKIIVVYRDRTFEEYKPR